LENMDIREVARIAGVPLYRVADALGISEPTLTRWLRKPLTAEKEASMMEAIKCLKEERERRLALLREMEEGQNGE